MPRLVLGACLVLAAWIVLVPLAGLLVTAFSEDTGAGPGALSLANFVDAFGETHVARLLVNSAVYAAGSAVLAAVLGGFLAAVVEKTDAPLRGLLHVGALLSLAIPGLLTTMAWMLVLSPNVGWVNLLLRQGLGLSASPFDIYSMGGMVWAFGSHEFPLAYLLLAPAMRALDSRMEEAAAVAGAHGWQVALRVTLPVLRPALLSALLLLFVGGLASFEVPRLIGVPAHIAVLTTAIQNATNDTPPAFGTAAALGMVLLAVSVVSVLLYRQATAAAGAFATIGGKGAEARRLGLGAWRWPVTALAMVVFVAALGLPLLTLAWQSFFAGPSLPFLPASGAPGWGNYRFVLRYPIFLEAVGTSVRVGAMAATLVVLLGLVLAWLAQRVGAWARAGIDTLAFAPIAIPSVIVGASVLFAYLLLPIPVYNTIWILLIAYLALFLPYGMRFAASGLAQLHKELEEAAEIAGAGTVQVFRRILLPALAPVLVSAWLYVFVLAARELGASIFLVGPDTQVLSTITLTMWEEGSSYGAVCALSMIQIVPLLAIVLALRLVERLAGRALG
jgi:iron(III) transport system permease protein